MSYEALEALGRERLSRHFFMREFLYSEIANWYQLRNLPDHPDVAVRVGRELCTELLEPLQMRFGRVHVRSGYRSPSVNAFGNQHDLNCASNDKNFGEHIWDYPDSDGAYGASACIVVPVLADYIALGGSWTAMAWWIHGHLPYSSLCFFSKLGAFNIGWHEAPKRRIDSFATPRGCLTKPQMANHTADHSDTYTDFLSFVDTGVRQTPQSAFTRVEEVLMLKPAPSIRSTSKTTRPDSLDVVESGSDERIRYRAVHTKTNWRRVNSHTSLHNAVYGKDGAAGLFAGRVRIDRERHGEALFVVVWRDGDQGGIVIRPSPKGEVEHATVPIDDIERMEAQGGATTTELVKYFS